MDSEATYRGVVYPWQCDHNGHMNVMWFVSKLDEANWSLLARVGLLKPSASRKEDRGFVALQQNISYKHEVHAGDLLEVRSQLTEVREKVVRFTHELLNSETGDVAAVCEMTTIHMDRIARKSTPIPPALREAALKHVEAANPATTATK
jgi:acyl-CoA thioester hydrolase